MTDDGPRVAHALWQALEAALKSPQSSRIPEAYVQAKAALDALVAAIGADQGQAA